MGGRSKWEYFREIFRRYREASRLEKGRILEEFCRVCGYNRKYAIRKLSGPPPGSKPRLRRRGVRGPHYGSQVISILRGVWEAAGYPWSVRLKAMVPLWMPWIRRHFRVSAEVERQLLSISARQMDRRLGGSKRRLKRRFYGRTKPGTLLKHHIPIRTDNWDVTVPGFGEVDLVSHSGNSGDGRFAYSLNFVDIHTAWVETGAILGKGRETVREALEEIRERLPFRLRGIDADNGLYGREWRLMMNLFQPSVKLLRKVRVGSRLTRKYDRPQTPLDRLLACAEADAEKLKNLEKLRESLDPFELARSIDRKLEKIDRLASRPATVNLLEFSI